MANPLYVKVDEHDNIIKFPYHQATFKAENPGDWPDVIEDSFLESRGIFRVRQVPFPSHLETRTRSIKQELPQKYEGVWTQVFSINKLAPEFAEQNQRGKRFGLLKECDWTQLPDNGLTEEQRQQWAVYRQQLRDISSLPGWPYDIDWPVSPEVDAVPIDTVG
jgi:hypothetical protein